MIPYWAKPNEIDATGNGYCKACSKKQSLHFSHCVYCCEHCCLTISVDHDYGIVFECSECGKNFDFTNEFVSKKYIAVRNDVRMRFE